MNVTMCGPEFCRDCDAFCEPILIESARGTASFSPMCRLCLIMVSLVQRPWCAERSTFIRLVWCSVDHGYPTYLIADI